MRDCREKEKIMKTAKKLAMTFVIALTLLVLAVTLTACGESGGNNGGADKPQGGRPTQDVDPYVKAVEIVDMPYKTEYLTGDKVDLSGLKFNATWILDGEEEVIEMVAADLDGYTPGRNDALTTDNTEVECVIGGYTFTIAITVSEQQADTPIADEYTPLVISKEVSPNSSASLKNNGQAATEDIVYNHRIYAAENLTSFDLRGGKGTRLIVKGGGLTGDNTAKRVKVHYIFKNGGNSEFTFRYYYDNNGEIGYTPMIRLEAGEVRTVEFVVDMSGTGTSQPWTNIQIGLDYYKDGKIIVGGYEVEEFVGGTYELALDGATFADGTTEKMLAPGDTLPETVLAAAGKEFLGWYDVTDPGKRYFADAEGNIEFSMPEDDIRLAPIVRMTEYANVSLKPRTTSGGSVPEVYYANNNKEAAGSANYSSYGYSETNVLYTLNAAASGTDIVSGCGNHLGNNFKQDRLVKLTVTWKSGGAVSFRHWIDFKEDDQYVRALSDVTLTVSSENQTATAYFVVPKDYSVNENNEAGFHMQLLEELTEETSFAMTCEYAYITE